jgi:hypothetical protein
MREDQLRALSRPIRHAKPHEQPLAEARYRFDVALPASLCEQAHGTRVIAARISLMAR